MFNILIKLGHFVLGLAIICLGLGLPVSAILVLFNVLPWINVAQMYFGTVLIAISSFVFIKWMRELQIMYPMNDEECRQYMAAKKQMKK